MGGVGPWAQGKGLSTLAGGGGERGGNLSIKKTEGGNSRFQLVPGVCSRNAMWYAYEVV